MGSKRAIGGRICRLDIVLEEAEAKSKVDAQTLNAALDLLARWALRRGQKMPEEAGMKPENLVTGRSVKGYGGMNGSN